MVTKESDTQGAINRPLRSGQSIWLMRIIAPPTHLSFCAKPITLHLHIKELRWAGCHFKGVPALEVTVEVFLAIKMYEQPAVHLMRDEHCIPGLLSSHIQLFVTDETPSHSLCHRTLK